MSTELAHPPLAQTRTADKRPGLDPRTILLHILVLGTLTFLVHTVAATAALVLATAVLVGFAVRPRSGALIVVVWSVVSGVKFAIVAWAPGTPLALLLPTLAVLVRLGPLMGAGMLFTGALSVSRFVSALELLRVPRSMTVTLAVMLRFTPTIGYELRHISDALRTRGMPLAPITFARAPMRTAELVVVPLVQRCTTVAEELSAAAITRGLERSERRTTRIPLRFSAIDGGYLLVLVLSSAAVIVIDGIGA